MPNVNIIGAGRVGRTLLRLIGQNVQHVASASHSSAEDAVRESGYGQPRRLPDMGPADIWLLTVPDIQIVHAAKALADVGIKPAIAIHCSGFHKADIMAPLGAKGWQLASAHPNLSFADPATAAANFSGTPCGVEGASMAVQAAEDLFASIGGVTFRIASERKELYHAAAVFSNNFATGLQAIARAAWRDAGVPDEIAAQLNASLIKATAENVVELGPIGALTGPAARGDRLVVKGQGEVVLEWNEQAGRLYVALSALAERLKSKGSF